MWETGVSAPFPGNGRSLVGDSMIASELDGGHALGFAPEREPTFASPLLVTDLVYCMYVVGPVPVPRQMVLSGTNGRYPSDWRASEWAVLVCKLDLPSRSWRVRAVGLT